MTAIKENLNSVFDPAGRGLEADILEVLQSILRLHSITPEELFIKWEVYSLKMGEGTKLDLSTARLFAKDVQDSVERGAQERHQKQNGRAGGGGSERRTTAHATPRSIGAGDVFGMYVQNRPEKVRER